MVYSISVKKAYIFFFIKFIYFFSTSLPIPRIYLFIYKKEYTNDTFIDIENECPDIFFLQWHIQKIFFLLTDDNSEQAQK